MSTVEPFWGSIDPLLLRALGSDVPVCGTTQVVVADKDGEFVHSYTVFAPSLAQAELENRFRQSTRAVGYEITDLPSIGLGFRDEQKHLSGRVSGAELTVSGLEKRSPRDTALAIASQAKLDTLGLSEALGDSATWTSMSFTRRGQGDLTLEAAVTITDKERSVVEEWAKKQKLKALSGAWIRKHDPDDRSASAIIIELSPSGRLSIGESRSGQGNVPACVSHPSRSSNKLEDTRR